MSSTPKPQRRRSTPSVTRKHPVPDIVDPVAHWFSPRAVRALHAYTIVSLADLTVRIPRRRLWWSDIPDLGAASAQAIEPVRCFSFGVRRTIAPSLIGFVLFEMTAAPHHRRGLPPARSLLEGDG